MTRDLDRTRKRIPQSAPVWTRGVVLVAVLMCTGVASGQIVHVRGQDVVPVFEGWEENPDGTFNLLFGYFNRNWDERLHVPVGPDNNIEPGGPDQGQPTHFLPRRNRYVFRIKVPKDFGTKEIVWTLTSHGKTNGAYATLNPLYRSDHYLEQWVLGSFGHKAGPSAPLAEQRLYENRAPVVTIEGATRRTAKVGEPLTVTAVATDDGVPEPKPAPIGSPTQPPGRRGAWGLRLAWFVYRGPAEEVSFQPGQFGVYPDYRPNSNTPWSVGWNPPPVPADGKFPVAVTFTTPGTFVLRVMAHDGGLQSTRDLTVTVH